MDPNYGNKVLRVEVAKRNIVLDAVWFSVLNW